MNVAPSWTGKDGQFLEVTEYAPGRWTSMITDPRDLAIRKGEMAHRAREFEAQLGRDFGHLYNCLRCGDGVFHPGETCLYCYREPDVHHSGPSDFTRVGIPEGYLRQCTIESFQGAAMQDLAREWVTPWPPSKPFLFMLGDRGNGKTHLSVAILRELWEQRRFWGKFCQVSEMLNAIRASYDPDNDATADGILSPYKMAPLLVLDDIGVGKQTPWVDEQLWLLVSYRYTRGLPTIASANPDGLDKTEPRVKERLMDVQSGVIWKFNGKNRRVA